MEKRTRVRLIIVMMLIALLLAGCDEPVEIPDRESVIPDDMVDITPENDTLPPVLHSDEFEEPIPLPYPVNTRARRTRPSSCRTETPFTSGSRPITAWTSTSKPRIW